MKRMVIFSNGNLSDTSFVKTIVEKDDFIVCTDGGARYALEQDLIPNVLIGDMDSVESEVYQSIIQKGTEIIRYPARKDKSDFELAVDYALGKKAKKILIFGLLGDRIDHFLGNILLLQKVRKENRSLGIIIYEGNKTIYFVDKELEIEGEINDELSVIPLTKIENITLKGLVYKLSNAVLNIGTSLGISNILKKKRVKISLKKGLVMVVHAKRLSSTPEVVASDYEKV